MPDFKRLLLAALATYRLAQLLPYDDGPLCAFARVRDWLDGKALKEEQRGAKYGFWQNARDGATCPYCEGVWFAMLCAALALRPSHWGDIFLLVWGIAGAQAWLQRRRD